MHRGRKRSRKLVESSSEVASSSTKYDNTYGLDRYNESQSHLHGTISGSSNAQVVTIASLPSARSCENVIRPSLVISEFTNKSVSHGRKNMEMSYDDFINEKEASMCVGVVPLQGIMIPSYSQQKNIYRIHFFIAPWIDQVPLFHY